MGMEERGACLRRAGQREQQVQGGLTEEQVLPQTQAELQGAEDRGEDRHLPHHRHPVLAVLVHTAQLLGQVESQDTHLGTQQREGSVWP